MRLCVADVVYPGVKSKRAFTNVFLTRDSRFPEWLQGQLRMINILIFFIFVFRKQLEASGNPAKSEEKIFREGVQ